MPARTANATTRAAAFDTEISRLGFEPRSELVKVDQIRPPADVATALALAPEEDVLIRKRHMYAADTPVQLATSYVPWSIAGRHPARTDRHRPQAAPTHDSPNSATHPRDSYGDDRAARPVVRRSRLPQAF